MYAIYAAPLTPLAPPQLIGIYGSPMGVWGLFWLFPPYAGGYGHTQAGCLSKSCCFLRSCGSTSDDAQASSTFTVVSETGAANVPGPLEHLSNTHQSIAFPLNYISMKSRESCSRRIWVPFSSISTAMNLKALPLETSPAPHRRDPTDPGSEWQGRHPRLFGPQRRLALWQLFPQLLRRPAKPQHGHEMS